jgi:hypothetical protein
MAVMLQRSVVHVFSDLTLYSLEEVTGVSDEYAASK